MRDRRRCRLARLHADVREGPPRFVVQGEMHGAVGSHGRASSSRRRRFALGVVGICEVDVRGVHVGPRDARARRRGAAPPHCRRACCGLARGRPARSGLGGRLLRRCLLSGRCLLRGRLLLRSGSRAGGRQVLGPHVGLRLEPRAHGHGASGRTLWTLRVAHRAPRQSVTWETHILGAGKRPRWIPAAMHP